MTMTRRPNRNRTLRLGWLGFHEEGIEALRAVIDAGFEIVGVLTLSPEKLHGRSGAVDYDRLLGTCQVPVHIVDSVNSPATLDLVASMQLDLLVVLGWSEILRREVLSLPRLGVVGAHASFLPHNRGSAPVNWAIINGETMGGNTLFWLQERLDGGPIIDQTAFPISVYDTCASIYRRVAESNRAMLLRFLEELEGGPVPGRAQSPGNEPLLKRRRPRDGEINWTWTSWEVYDFIRALTRPYPGAFSFIGNDKYYVWNAALLDIPAGELAAPGEILGRVVSPEPAACGLVVACCRGVLALLELQTEGGQSLVGQALSDLPLVGRTFSHGQ